MRRFLILVCAWLMAGRGPGAEPAVPAGREGGSRFRVEQAEGRWWLISPESKRFVALGVVHLAGAYRGGEALLRTRFGGDEAKATAFLLEQLKRWNCNSIGYDAPNELKPHLPYFAHCQALPISEWMLGAQFKFADVFDPAVEAKMRAEMRTVCLSNRDNPNLIGYYWTDMPMWDPQRAERLAGGNWVQFIRELPPEAPGKQAYVAFLLERYRTRTEALATRYEVEAERAAMLAHRFSRPARLDPTMAEDDSAFLGLIAKRYYSILGSETRKHDPRGLIFGDRYTNYAHPREVVQEALAWIDVLSVQPNGGFDRAYFDQLHRQTGKPVNICDHQVSFPVAGFKKVIWPPADTRQSALAQMDAFVREAFDRPYVIGYGRCQMVDHISPERRIKIGLLDAAGDPKPDLTGQLRDSYGDVRRKLKIPD